MALQAGKRGGEEFLHHVQCQTFWILDCHAESSEKLWRLGGFKVSVQILSFCIFSPRSNSNPPGLIKDDCLKIRILELNHQ